VAFVGWLKSHHAVQVDICARLPPCVFGGNLFTSAQTWDSWREDCCGGVPSVHQSRFQNAVHVSGTWLHMQIQDNNGSNQGQLQALQEASVPLQHSQQDQGRS